LQHKQICVRSSCSGDCYMAYSPFKISFMYTMWFLIHDHIFCLEDNQYLRLYVYHNNCNQYIYYTNVLQEFNIDNFRSKPHERTCSSSQFMYKPAGHVITGDLNTISNTSLRDVFAKGPKYREPKSINWKHNI
jgi:hypothetical protein